MKRKWIPLLALAQCFMAGALTMVMQTPAAETSYAQARNPTFTTDGRIVNGSKSIWQKDMYGQVQFCIDNDVIGSLVEVFDFGKGSIGPVFFMNGKQTLAKNESTFTADVRDTTSSSTKLGTYRLSLALLDDGLVKVESVCSLKDPNVLKSRYSVLQMPSYLNLYGEYIKKGKTVKFDAEHFVRFDADELKGATIKFFPDSPGKAFTILPQSCSAMSIQGHSMSFYAADNGVLSLLLDIRNRGTDADSANLSPNGIDFWQVDRLHLPDYGASRNLVQNPSFEAGFRYWGLPTYAQSAIPLKYKSIYNIDGHQAHSGSHSLHIRALRVHSPSSLGTLAIPFVPGQQYTLSFYAKGDSNNSLTLNAWARFVPQEAAIETKHLAVTKEWKRYTIPFTAPALFGAYYFDAQLTGSGSEQEGSVWLDDVQIEKGQGATEFTHGPVAAQLLSSARGNFLDYGQSPDFSLAIQSLPSANGTVSLSVEDFFFNKIFEKTYPFTTNSSGSAVLRLDDLSHLITERKLRGVCSVAAVFNVNGVKRPFKDYFRFSVMNFLDNTQKNKNIFNLVFVYSLQAGGPEMERFLARERAIGFGSFTYDFIRFANDMDYSLDEERMKLLKKYGFEPMGRPVLKLHDGVGGEISEEQETIKMENVKFKLHPSDQELAVFQAICALKAKNRPWNPIWWFTGESNPGTEPLESHREAFAKFLLATLHGIKQGNPNAKVLIEGGPWNIDPQYGTQWVERYIQDTRKLDPTARFDGAAAHTYQDFPEHPDLDANIQVFLDMLKRNGVGNWPVYLNEGGNYAPFNIPQAGMSPYIVQSANAWYIGPLSYDIGRAERISDAFSARNWLVALKYQDNVKCMNDFNTPSRYVDFDFTPRPYDKMPNTLGRILGNASFYKDVRFAPDTRCYVFIDDNTKVPIAVVWGCKESVDRWKESAPLYAVDFGRQNLKFVNLMENEVTFPKDAAGRTIIPASPFPIFIEGSPGTEKQLFDAVAHAVASNNSDSSVDISAYPDADGKASIVFANKVSKEFTGSAKIVLNHAESNLSLQLKPLERLEKRIPLPAVAHDKLLPFSADISIDGGISKHISNPYMLLKSSGWPELKVESGLAAWREIPAINVGGGLSVRIALSGTNVMAAIESTDQSRADGEPFAGTGLYIDPFGALDQWTAPKLVTQNLAAFEFIKTDRGMEAMCHNVQGTQAGSGNAYLVAGQIQKLISVKVSSDAKGTMMVFSIPQEVLAPLILKPGSRFGINIVIPSAKDGVKSLAPVSHFKNAREPGEINFVTVIVSD